MTVNQSYDPEAGPARGVLRRAIAPGVYGHARRIPAPSLRPWILHYWLVSWDIPDGVQQTVETIPHPNIHLVFSSGEPASAVVYGVPTIKFSRVLEGKARTFGVKFRAGGFRAFYSGPVSALRGKSLPATEVFGPEVESVAAMLTGDHSENALIAAADQFFLRRIPAHDANAERAASLVEMIQRETEIHSVSEVALRAHASERSLERLFREYVGISPKWVIRRYRLHEVVENLNAGLPVDWAALAASLGYYDQSHLIREFRSLTGYSPERFRRLANQQRR